LYWLGFWILDLVFATACSPDDWGGRERIKLLIAAAAEEDMSQTVNMMDEACKSTVNLGLFGHD